MIPVCMGSNTTITASSFWSKHENAVENTEEEFLAEDMVSRERETRVVRRENRSA